ncbi:MAG: MATE family efflux transporter [Planctomycetota bacterium]|jgi:O-antigen/teichoic acid export membrane protein
MALIRKAVLAGGGSVVCLAIGIVTNIVLSRTLLPEGMGRYQVPIEAGTIIAAIMCFGIGQAGIYIINGQNVPVEKVLSNCCWLISIGLCILFTVVPIVLRSFAGYFGAIPLWGILILTTGIVSTYGTAIMRPILVAQLKIRQNVSVNLGMSVFFLLSVIIFTLLDTITVNTALSLFAAGQIAGFILVIFYLRRNLSFLKFDFDIFLRTLSYGIRLFMANIVQVVNASIALMLLRYLMPEDFSTIGHYGRGARIATLIMLLPAALGPLLYAKWSSLDDRHYKGQIEMAMRVYLFCATVVILGIITTAKYLILYMYGPEYLPAVPVVRILAMGVLFRCTFSVTNAALTSSGRASVTAWLWSASVLIITVFCFWLVPRIGMRGAAIADAVSAIIVFVSGLFILKIYYKVDLCNCLVLTKEDALYVLSSIKRDKTLQES